jgi:hypothetical protein
VDEVDAVRGMLRAARIAFRHSMPDRIPRLHDKEPMVENGQIHPVTPDTITFERRYGIEGAEDVLATRFMITATS